MKLRDKITNKTSYKAHTSIKTIGIILLVGFFSLLLIGNISAMDWDNVLDYENDDMKVKITNWLGLLGWLGFDDEIGTAELKSHSSVNEIKQVSVGENVVMWYDFNFVDLYTDGIGEITFKNMRTGEYFERDYHLVYWGEEEINVYGMGNCKTTLFNGTKINCEEVIIGKDKIYNWLPYNSRNIPKGNIRIGVMVDVKSRERTDVIWTITGKEVSRHAEFTGNGEFSNDIGAAAVEDDDYNMTLKVLTNGILTKIRMGSASATPVTSQITVYQGGVQLAQGNITYDFDDSIAQSTLTLGLENYSTVIRSSVDGGLFKIWFYNAWGSNQYHETGGSEFNGTLFEYASQDMPGKHASAGAGPLLTFNETTAGPSITLNYPIDTFNSSNQTINFNGSVVSPVGIVNVSLYIDGVLNETNSSGVNETDYIFIKNLSEGNHNWTYEACDIDKCNNVTARNFTIDITNPIVNITYPTEIVNYHLINTNLSLNWSVSDAHLDSCWYNYNGTNISVTCSDNHTNINITDYSNRNITFYVNDTFGFLGSDYQEWNYSIFGNEKIYNLSSFETAEETFWINITSNGIAPTNTKFIYNGTSYSANIVNTEGNYYSVSRTIDIPTGTGNKTFFFNFTISGTEISSSIQTQLINLTNFTYCTTGTPFINISFKNETISEEDTTAAISSTWNYWLGSGTVHKTLSFSNVSENPYYEFCLVGINRTLETNVSLIYSNSISQQRNFVGDFSLTNITTNQTLYLLPTTEGLYITFQVINIAEQPIPDVTSNVTKSGVLVGSGTTDDAGTISYFLDPDTSYVFTFFKEGYDIYITTLTPTQTTFTITLGIEEVIEEDDYTRGITYSVSPGAISLVNDTNTYFNFTLTSTYWDVEEFGFNLTNQDGDLLDSVSASTNGGTVFILQNTTNDTTITMTFFWIIDGNVTTSSVFWAVLDSSGAGFGLTTFFTHLTAYLDTEMFGLNSNSMIILIYIIIFITTGVMSFKYGITSPTAISLMIFGLVFLFEVHLGWIPSISNFPILTILFAVVSIALVLKEELR